MKKEDFKDYMQAFKFVMDNPYPNGTNNGLVDQSVQTYTYDEIMNFGTDEAKKMAEEMLEYISLNPRARASIDKGHPEGGVIVYTNANTAPIQVTTMGGGKSGAQGFYSREHTNKFGNTVPDVIYIQNVSQSVATEDNVSMLQAGHDISGREITQKHLNFLVLDEEFNHAHAVRAGNAKGTTHGITYATANPEDSPLGLTDKDNQVNIVYSNKGRDDFNLAMDRVHNAVSLDGYLTQGHIVNSPNTNANAERDLEVDGKLRAMEFVMNYIEMENAISEGRNYETNFYGISSISDDIQAIVPHYEKKKQAVDRAIDEYLGIDSSQMVMTFNPSSNGSYAFDYTKANTTIVASATNDNNLVKAQPIKVASLHPSNSQSLASEPFADLEPELKAEMIRLAEPMSKKTTSEPSWDEQSLMDSIGKLNKPNSPSIQKTNNTEIK